MKKIALAAALSLAAGPFGAGAAFAGSMAEPVIEPQVQPTVIEQDTSSSSAGIVIPIVALLLVAAAVAD